jgi:hypothetical protein
MATPPAATLSASKGKTGLQIMELLRAAALIVAAATIAAPGFVRMA